MCRPKFKPPIIAKAGCLLSANYGDLFCFTLKEQRKNRMLPKTFMRFQSYGEVSLYMNWVVFYFDPIELTMSMMQCSPKSDQEIILLKGIK